MVINMRNLVLYIAMSLDGFISDVKGGVDWISGDLSEPENFGSYPEFIETVDTVILGYNTYHQITSELSTEVWPYCGKQSYVFTGKSLENQEEIIFTSENITELVQSLKNKDGKDIWLCGGASLANQLIDEIDIFRIAVIPTILGKGIPLFNQNSIQQLKLVKTEIYNGITELIYTKRD